MKKAFNITGHWVQSLAYLYDWIDIPLVGDGKKRFKRGEPKEH